MPGLGLLPNELSAVKPERTARVASRAGAQVGTMRVIDSSSSPDDLLSHHAKRE